MRFRHLLSPILVAAVLGVPRANGATPNVALEAVATANQPMYMFHAGDDRLFILERGGRIRIFKPGQGVLPTPFLDISEHGRRGRRARALRDRLPSELRDERLLLRELLRCRVGRLDHRALPRVADPNVADPASETIVFALAHPSGTHNGRADRLRRRTATSSSRSATAAGGDTTCPCNAQRNVKLREDPPLRRRIRTDTPPYTASRPTTRSSAPNDPLDAIDDEVWATGFRNPWRFSFDRGTGDLLLGDVGEGAARRSTTSRPGAPGGENYGWKVMEGESCHDPDPIDEDCPADDALVLQPALHAADVHVYPHGGPGRAPSSAASSTGGAPSRTSRAGTSSATSAPTRLWPLEQTEPGRVGQPEGARRDERPLQSLRGGRGGRALRRRRAKASTASSRTSAGRPQRRFQQACINVDEPARAPRVATKRGAGTPTACIDFAGQRQLAHLGLPRGQPDGPACLDDRRARARRARASSGSQAREAPRVSSLPAPSRGRTSATSPIRDRRRGGRCAAANRLTARALRRERRTTPSSSTTRTPTGARCQAEVGEARRRSCSRAIWKAARCGEAGRASSGDTRARRRARPRSWRDRVLTFVDVDATNLVGTTQPRPLVTGLELKCGGQSLAGALPWRLRLGGRDSGPASRPASTSASAATSAGRSRRSTGSRSTATRSTTAGRRTSPVRPRPRSSVRHARERRQLDGGRGRLPAPLRTTGSSPTRPIRRGAPTAASPTTSPRRSSPTTRRSTASSSCPPAPTRPTTPTTRSTFPVGTIIAKTFSFAHDLRNLALGEDVVETRLLIHRAGRVGGPPLHLERRHERRGADARRRRASTSSWIDVDGNAALDRPTRSRRRTSAATATAPAPATRRSDRRRGS